MVFFENNGDYHLLWDGAIDNVEHSLRDAFSQESLIHQAYSCNL